MNKINKINITCNHYDIYTNKLTSIYGQITLKDIYIWSLTITFFNVLVLT